MASLRVLKCVILSSLFLCCQGVSSIASVSLHLACASDRYLEQEFLYVTVTLRNEGTEEVQILRLLEPDAGLMGFEITAPSGEKHLYQSWCQSSLSDDAYANSLIWLAPGGQYATSIDLSDEMVLVPGERELRRSCVLSSAGDYLLRACYTIPEEAPSGPLTLWSNELRLSVVEPTGADSLAGQIVQAGPRTQADGPWNARPEQAECYEQVLREHPTSVYASYARWSLASALSLEGSHTLRGNEEAIDRFRSAAALFLSVAESAGRNAFGLRATEAAAKSLARLGQTAEAQALLEGAFTWPSTTDGDRARLLVWMGHLETGFFPRSAGVVTPETATQLSLPLRPLAQALGFSVGWRPEAGSVTVSAPRVMATLQPGQDSMIVNGARRTGIRTTLRNGQTEVSLSVIATLMAEHYGKGMARAFPQLIAQAAP